ncbi:hypothetical protein CEXT_669321 [Caerostris extrusa]|uniref:Uncharacterized protein n=1 Tax=Caerostris extrusa TaxID=172846 RepID=A0AAV4RPU8_CAEEX|nr:hypothetical protein CEXT_669321 [Caerostris extrusa]
MTNPLDNPEYCFGVSNEMCEIFLHFNGDDVDDIGCYECLPHLSEANIKLNEFSKLDMVIDKEDLSFGTSIPHCPPSHPHCHPSSSRSSSLVLTPSSPPFFINKKVSDLQNLWIVLVIEPGVFYLVSLVEFRANTSQF